MALMVKTIQTISTVLFVLSLPMLLVTTDLRFAVTSTRLYEYGFDRYYETEYDKYEIYAGRKLDREELRAVASDLTEYFNSDEEFIDTEAFSPQEVLHLKDVKGLIHLDYRLQLASLAYILAYIVIGFALLRRAFWKSLARHLVWGSGATIALLAVLGIGALIGFDTIFLWFHRASFSNELWQLPLGSNLLLMFAQNFFRDATLFIVAAIIGEAIIIGGISWGLLRLRAKPRRGVGTGNEERGK